MSLVRWIETGVVEMVLARAAYRTGKNLCSLSG